MSDSVKSKIPFIFLIAISLWWSFYYQSDSNLNDFGKANFEIFFLLDALLVLPILCFFCIKDTKDSLIKALVLGSLGIAIGSYIIPEQSKFIWSYLEGGRYVVLFGIVLLEIVAMLTIYLVIKSAIDKKYDPDVSIEKTVKKVFGQTIVAAMLCFEIRMWIFAFFSKNINRENFRGNKHFTYHDKDGTQGDLMGFILLILFEMPLMHLLLHFLWSPFAANVVSFFTIISLVFFLGEYRAVAVRPISLTNSDLIIRYGLYNPLTVPACAIKHVNLVDSEIKVEKACKSIKHYNYFGDMNVLIELDNSIRGVKKIYLNVDSPIELVNDLNSLKSKF